MSSSKKNKRKKSKNKRNSSIINIYPALKNTKDGQIYGYINDEGTFVIKPSYSIAYDFNNSGLAIVESGGKFGLINSKGQYVIKPIYDSINQFKENRAIFNLKDYMGVIDEKGSVITNKKYNFISDYNEGRATVGVSSSSGAYKYGYIDLNGNEIIIPIYSQADGFNEGVALVKIKDKEYRLIDTSGKILNNYNFDYVSQYGDGLMVFGNSFEGPLGYIDKDGKEVIEPKFKSAEGFKNGVAIVSEAESYIGPYGLINKEGKYVYQPIFNDIKILGEDRVVLGMSIGEEKTPFRNVYAIGDTKGNKLTEFIYLVIGDYKNGLAYASNESDTFFIEKSGNIANDLPKVSGSGELSLKDGLVYANIDYSPYYLDRSGKIIYKPNDVIKLDNTYSVLIDKYKPNINYLIYNPVVQGVMDKTVQKNINSKLKEMSYFKKEEEGGKPKDEIITKDDVLNYDYYGSFKVKYFKKNLLILELDGYYYPVGAAHGMPSMKTPSINLVTGKLYTLGDLFMPGVNWTGELNKIIENMIKTDPQYDYIFKDAFKGIKEKQDFYIDDNNLYIYFYPYEIGPYSAGFITFKIPFTKIEGMINRSSDFYKAFN